MAVQAAENDGIVSIWQPDCEAWMALRVSLRRTTARFAFKRAIRPILEIQSAVRSAVTTQADSSFIWGRGGNLICWWWNETAACARRGRV